MKHSSMTRSIWRPMRRSTRSRWYVALGLVTLLTLASTAGAAQAPGDVAYSLSGVSGADPAEAPTWKAQATLDVRPWWDRTTMDADHDGMFDMLDVLVDAGSLEPLDVLVDLDHTPTDAEAIRLASLVGAQGWALFPNIRIVGLSAVPPMVLDRLLDVPGVVMLEPRMDAVPLQDVATRAIKARESGEYSPTTAWELGFTGNGVIISIMDTGVDDAHSALAGKFVAGVDFTKPNRPRLYPRDGTYNPDDQAGHGTTCAGIATSTGSPGGEYMGAAPDANLVDLRIGTRFGFSPGELPQNTYDAALQAIDWLASHSDTAWPGGARGIDINSLSWGIPFDGASDGSDGYSRGLDQAVLEGIVSCVAIGNEGPDNTGITGMSASSRSIIVGALDDLNTINRTDDIIASYSTRGPRHDDGDDYPYDEMMPHITAPGTNIYGVMYENRGDGSGGGYGGRGSGTSYATPYVAGISAILLEANPSLTPLVLREILMATAERRGGPEYPTLDPFWNGDFGWGMVDTYWATFVALEIENVGNIDVELQAFVTNVSSGSILDPDLRVEGIAWARVGAVDHLDWRIDQGPWNSVGLDEANATFGIDPATVGEGTHILEVRAVGIDGKYSVWRPVEINVTQSDVDASNAVAMASGVGWFILVVVVIAVAASYIWLKRRDLVYRSLDKLGIERAP